MTVALLIVIVGGVAKKGWFYWFFAALAVLWLSVCYELFYISSGSGSGADLHTGLITAVLLTHFGNGPWLAAWGIFIFILSYGGAIWLLRKGWVIEKTGKQPFALSKAVKIATVAIWSIYWIAEAFAIYAIYTLSQARMQG
jgi:hypothetical protein